MTMTLLLAPHGHDQVVSMRLRGVTTYLSLRSRHGRSISSTADIVLRTANLEDMFLQWRLVQAASFLTDVGHKSKFCVF